MPVLARAAVRASGWVTGWITGWITRLTGWVVDWQRVRVSGPSMVPTLTDGDLLLVRLGAGVRPGDVVLAQFVSRPGHFVLKRAERAMGSDWFVRSDNTFAGGDSAVHGPATVLGRVVLRWPARSSARTPIRIVPRRLARQRR
jgi:phage repressor protein C with HTH and peptisase S24 domain